VVSASVDLLLLPPQQLVEEVVFPLEVLLLNPHRHPAVVAEGSVSEALRLLIRLQQLQLPRLVPLQEEDLA
jgi:hypothetical protein